LTSRTDQNPTQSTLFRDISSYVLNQTSQNQTEPASKKRKLDDSNAVQNGAAGGLGSLASTAVSAFKTYPGVSFSIPQRKKLTLELVSNKKEGGIRGLGADGKVEFGIAWKDVGEPSLASSKDEPSLTISQRAGVLSSHTREGEAATPLHCDPGTWRRR
jgi:hypothetical protein